VSFILDALKKSENARQRQIGPSLADVPMRRKKDERPWWAFAIAALLIVNLSVLAIVLLRNDGAADAKPMPVEDSRASGSAPSVGTSRAAPAPVLTPLPAPSSTAVVTSPVASSLAEEAELDPVPEDVALAQAGPSVASTVPAGPPMVRPIDPPSVAPLAARPTYDPQAAGLENLPTHGSLVAGGTNLPDLRLDIHVYSPMPAERFVYVNMRKYAEGQALSEGPAVERITSDGVVLNQQGIRFLLPRQ
jgi:general secretion pathway protein B